MKMHHNAYDSASQASISDNKARIPKRKASKEQQNAVLGVAGEQCSILTGGPGVGKTTTTQVIGEPTVNLCDFRLLRR